MPDTAETFSYFLKYDGSIQISIRFTPCIQPVSNADSRTDKPALRPVTKNKASADKAPVPKIIPAHKSGFVNTFLYSPDTI